MHFNLFQLKAQITLQIRLFKASIFKTIRFLKKEIPQEDALTKRHTFF